jgi:hypothetical protein
MNLTTIDTLNKAVIASQTDSVVQAAQNAQYNLSLAQVNAILQTLSPSDTGDINTFNSLKSQLSSSDPGVVGNAEQTIMQQYQGMADVGQLPSVPYGFASSTTTTASGPSGTGLIGGAIGDGAKIVGMMLSATTKGILLATEAQGVTTEVKQIQSMTKTADNISKMDQARLKYNTNNIQKALTALETETDPDVIKVLQGRIQTAQNILDKYNLSDLSSATKETDAVTEAVELGSELQGIAKAAEAIGAVSGPVGLAIELLANAAQALTAGVQYGSIAAYNTQFNDAINAAKQPVSVSDLKSMSGTQMLDYFQTMMATGGQANSATPTMSLSQIEGT